MNSLRNAGEDQEHAYDFSFSEANVERRGPVANDLGIVVLVDDELAELERPEAAASRFLALHRERDACTAVVHVTSADRRRSSVLSNVDHCVQLHLPPGEDPLDLRRQIALKVLLNAHSTATMARLGRVIGNTMTNVSPSNLKLVGRATFLVLSHVNDVLERSALGEAGCLITYAEANAVLMDAMTWVREQEMGQTAEVALSIIRVLESLAAGAAVSWEDARRILDEDGLAEFLRRRFDGS